MQKWMRNPEILSNQLDDGVVMLNMSQGRYYSANEMGALIWDILAEPVTEMEITNELLKEYEIEEKVCREKICDFLSKLSASDLISCVD